MKMLFQSALLGLATAVLAGCSWMPQKVNIAPQLVWSPSNPGNGERVVVTVQDSRPSFRIGYRAIDADRGEISTDQDLAAILQRKIIEGLTKEGFKAVPASEEPARVLKVEIRALEYTTAMDFMKASVRTKAGIQAYSKREEFIFDQSYVAERSKETIEALRPKTNEEMINGVLSDVLQRLLADPKLARVLGN